jgi:hypothetical protein
VTITYTNVAKTNILDPLQLLVFTEFKPTPVEMSESFDSSLMTRGEYIRYWLLDSGEVEKHSDGETRDYEVEMVYYFDVTRHEYKKAFDDVYSDRMEHLKQLLDENRSYTSSSTYRWHNIVVETDPIQTVEELEEIEEEETIAQRFLVTITRSNFR